LTAPPRHRAGRRGPRSPTLLAALASIAVLAFAALVALGTWQVQRRAWKHELVARVEQRVHAPEVAAPGPAQWPAVNANDDAYRRVRLTGTYLHDRETRVQAVTALGGGFWVLTPLQTADGIVLVNRGFVPPEARDPATRSANRPQGDTVVTGLLRITEPGGGFLRHNDPAADRWYSRDVPAIAAARGLAGAAPYFVDADDLSSPDKSGARHWPAGGLTVIAFPDNHLVYALTWYALAAMVAAAAVYVWRVERRPRAGSADAGQG
jgi:surfeit locus 1 family protein